jgi:hypothetical protein
MISLMIHYLFIKYEKKIYIDHSDSSFLPDLADGTGIDQDH